MGLEPGHVVVDGTLGSGGHAVEFLRRILPGGFLFGIDRDPEIAKFAVNRFISQGFVAGRDFEVRIAKFSVWRSEIQSFHESFHPDRLFFDLGVSSLQLDSPSRGFSFRADGPLDMRMNPEEPGTMSAASLVNGLPERELELIIRDFGEERHFRQITRALLRARPITSTLGLREVVASAIPRRLWPPQADPATRTFQALRIAVNGEFEEIDRTLAELPAGLASGARVGFLTFHSLEDRKVKDRFRALAVGCICPPKLPMCSCGRKPAGAALSGRPIVAGAMELERNPRSRSAKLRVFGFSNDSP